MATADALLTWARKEIGTTEHPPGSNHVHYWDDVGMSHLQGNPWCAAFVLAGLERVGVGPVTRSVYVPQIRADYQRAGKLRPIAEARPGDQVLFKFGPLPKDTHTGIVESIDPHARTVDSIDGNTSSALGGSEVNGGGVFRRTRPWALTWGVGHLSFDPPHPPPVVVHPLPGEHAMRFDIQVPPLADGTGYWDLDGAAGRPLVPWPKFMSVEVNGGGVPDPAFPGIVRPSDYAGHTRLWLGGFTRGAQPLLLVVAEA